MNERLTVLGLDLSLTGTGVCHVPGTEPETFTIRTKPAEAMGERLDRIGATITDLLDQRPYVVLEDLPFHAKAAGQVGMVHGVVRRELWLWECPTIVVPPATLKTWATGKGNATKPDMRVEALKRYGLDERDDNRVDAFFLWTLGAHVLGDPVVALPQTHLRALDKLDLTAIGAAA